MRWLMRVLALAVLIGAIAFFSCSEIKHGVVSVMSPKYEPAEKGERLSAEFTGEDEKRPRIEVQLTQVASKFVQITEMVFVPGDPRLMIVFEKAGTAYWLDLEKGERGVLFKAQVLDDSEQGLLGLAFHPKFAENGKFYVNLTVASSISGKDADRIDEYSVRPGADLRTAKVVAGRTIIELDDPYQNHNGGQTVFGADGYLYTAFGDGGWKDDPHGHGQDTGTLLGDLLRIDVDKPTGGKEYGIPADNPFIGKEGYQPEIFATGLRNPWRFSFDSQGRIVAGDVGQDDWEEVTFVEKGMNLGWNIKEARHCFQPKKNCPEAGLTDPIFEYGREEGGSVTGGFVALGDHVPELTNKYVFGDFLSGKLWALDLPEKADRTGPPARAYALGKWPILPSTFARDERGTLYVADYPSGLIFRIDPAGKK